MSYPRKTKKIRKVLECLGFVAKSNSGRGGHYKYVHRTKFPLVKNQPPFIMIIRHNADHGHYHVMIYKQLRCFGFTDDEIKCCC